MPFAGNRVLYYLLFLIFYFFSNSFTLVPFLHHFPVIFARRAQNKSETGRGLLLYSYYFRDCVASCTDCNSNCASWEGKIISLRGSVSLREVGTGNLGF